MASANGGGSELLDTWLYGGGLDHPDHVGDLRAHILEPSRDHTHPARTPREGEPWPGSGSLA
jgi:hypothetical protein